MNTTIRLRTADKAYEEIHKMDPNTSVTRYYIQNLVKSGALPVTRVGKKTLVNMDELLQYLRCHNRDK